MAARLGRVWGAMLEDVGSKLMFSHISWLMLWHLGAKMAHKSARRRQDNHQIFLEVKVLISLSMFEIGASRTLCCTRVEFLKHCVLKGFEITTMYFTFCFNIGASKTM